MTVDPSVTALLGFLPAIASPTGAPALASGVLPIVQAAALVEATALLAMAAMFAYILSKFSGMLLGRVFILNALFLGASGLTFLANLTSAALLPALPLLPVILALATATAALAAALALLQKLPEALTLPSRAAMGASIARLEHEIVGRRTAEEGLQRAHDELGSRIAEGTAELFRRNTQLQEEVVEHERLEAALRESQLILNSARRLALSSAGFDKHKATMELLALLAENHPFPSSAMFREDRRTGRFTCMASHGMPRDGMSTFQFPADALRDAARAGTVRTLPCSDHTTGQGEPAAEGESLAGLLLVPVMYEETCLSVLVLAGTRPFTASEIAFVENLRLQLAVVQHNLQLFADAERMARELHVRNIEIAQKNLQLEDISRTKSEFVANMSHELRTPLNAVLGFTGTLLMRLPGPLTADQDKQLRTVQSSARHLLSLINDLLDVEKIESGKYSVRLEEVILQSVIREVFETLQPLAARKNLEFRMTLPKADIRIHTDRRAVSQMLINLVNNAIKFTEQGYVSLQLTRRRAGNMGTVEMLVSDSGIGIMADRQGQLFQPFAQLDASSTRSYDGTGLGLYLSRRLATLVGAQLKCKSEYGKGSVFTLALPVQHA